MFLILSLPSHLFQLCSSYQKIGIKVFLANVHGKDPQRTDFHGIFPISELLTNSKSFSVRYSNCEMSVPCWTRPEQIKGENRRKERESLFSVCEISAFIWEVIKLEHLPSQHAGKQFPTLIAAANLLPLSLVLARSHTHLQHSSCAFLLVQLSAFSSPGVR